MSENLKNSIYRATSQTLLPVKKDYPVYYSYDIYPAFKIGDDQIFSGFESLAGRILENKTVTIDGYSGIFFEQFVSEITGILKNKNCSSKVIYTSSFLRSRKEIAEITAPFLGGDDPLFGRKCTLELQDFFVAGSLNSASPDPDSEINIIAGPGASLAGWPGLKIYTDLPKNEIQYRARAGKISNLGMSPAADPRQMYKTFYFVDWVVLNSHKEKILPAVDIFVDGQRPEMPVWINGEKLRETLSLMTRSPFRARPWFEPGAWGGKWIMDNIPGLDKNVPNYAWSFELITPENGLIIESSSLMLEVSFDCLMYLEGEAVLGDCYPVYGTNFPIRFDFLDTFDGGNLSLQCHPRPDYIKSNFGEPFTQEEAYYILDCKEGSAVYLGFTENINPARFRLELEKSRTEGTTFNAEKYILRHPSGKHDLFLVPYGTIHGSGRNNLVLEISSTPYIYTFKMYDWLRPDLDGKPRTLNIERGMENLFFERKGKYVTDNLISRPVLIGSGHGWKLYDLPTHESHSYRIRRYHFNDKIVIDTEDKCLVMSLTEGKSILVTSANGRKELYSFAETFIIPAAAGSISIFNNSDGEAILTLAFIK